MVFKIQLLWPWELFLRPTRDKNNFKHENKLFVLLYFTFIKELVCLILESGHLSHNGTLFAKLFNIYLHNPLIFNFTCFQVFLKLLLEVTCTVFLTACSQQTTLCLTLLHWNHYKYAVNEQL